GQHPSRVQRNDDLGLSRRHDDHRDRRTSRRRWLVRQRPHSGNCVRPRRPLALILLAASTVSCAATTYDSSISTATPAPTTTVLPTGTAAELLPQLVTESAGLAALISDGGDKTAAVESQQELWGGGRTDGTG